MANLPHPWDAYVRLQNSLGREHRLSDRSWGTEAGMAYILGEATASPPTQPEINQVVATSRRRERHHGSRRASMPEHLTTPHPDSYLQARNELAVMRSRLSDRNWKLLATAGSGVDYKEIARRFSTSQGNLRVKVLRLRREMALLVA